MRTLCSERHNWDLGMKTLSKCFQECGDPDCLVLKVASSRLRSQPVQLLRDRLPRRKMIMETSVYAQLNNQLVLPFIIREDGRTANEVVRIRVESDAGATEHIANQIATRSLICLHHFTAKPNLIVTCGPSKCLSMLRARPHPTPSMAETSS